MNLRHGLFLVLLVCLARDVLAAELAFPLKKAVSTNALRLFPERIRLRGKDDRQQVLVSAKQAGQFLDVTRQATFQIADPERIQIDQNGVVTPQGSGTTKLTVTVKGQTLTIPVQVEQGETFLPLDFQNDIVPIFTRRGCNGGGCHGKTTGQGGFQLSLFGYNPEADYDWLTRDSAARRISPHNPEASLLLLKPTMAIGHGGGLRLRETEPEFHRLARWIENNTPQTAPESAPAIERLEVFPDEASLRPGDRQQLVVIARFADGSTRDVTRLVVFGANEESIAKVDEWGLVTAGNQLGEGAITATYSGQVAVSRVQIPLEGTWKEPDFPIRNFIDQHVLDRLRSLNIPPPKFAMMPRF